MESKNTKFKNRQGFTLIESIVAMGISVLVLSFGAIGLVRFRASIELENAYADLSSYIKTYQNKSRNAVSIGPSGTGIPLTPAYYALQFTGNTCNPSGGSCYAIFNCGTSGSNASCPSTPLEGNLGVNSFRRVNITISDASCRRIAFLRNDSRMVKINVSNGVITPTGVCTITLQHMDIGSTRSITLDLTNNEVQFSK